jgi:Ni,Fe-hydrogenase maturation factor
MDFGAQAVKKQFQIDGTSTIILIDAVKIARAAGVAMKRMVHRHVTNA